MTNTTNLASARLGAQAIACSDDFFADKTRLIQDAAPVFLLDRYDDHGKWMDGWESRRRRSMGHDWCVIKLAVPGRLQRFDVDTTHFTGNYPPGARVEGADTDACPEPDSAAWRPLTPMLALSGDHAHSADCLDGDTVYRWIRLVIYPDGGVARLRAWGQPQIDVSANGRAELSALIHGGRIVGYSDAHYGNVEAVLTAGRGVDMGDGWETARRRVPGNEWLVIALGAPGVIDEIEIDTAHFKGNYPAGVSVQAAAMPADLSDQALITQAMFWPELLAYQALSADHIHRFPVAAGDAVSHIRVNSHPDGGMSRIRAFGRFQAPASAPPTTDRRLNR